MSDEIMAWYHCGRCGSLFQSPSGDLEDRRCAKCGQDPSTGTSPARAAALPIRNLPPQHHSSRHHEPVEVRRPKRNFMMLKLFGGWVVVTAAIAISIRLIWPDDPAPTVKANAPDTSIKGTSGDADVVALTKAMPKCGETLGGFLCASVPEERTQFVHNPVAIAGRVARFYSLNPLTRLDPAGLKPGGQSLLKVPGEQAVEARWTSDDGRLLDCVFIFQDDEWRLDWNHFARYSDYPISLFLAGDGEPEGEFRLLVRERLVKERSENSPMSLVFYEPRFGRPQSEGQATPEFIVPRDSEAARMLTAGFKALADHKAAFGSTLPPIDPEGMIRVRVRIRRLAEPNQTGQKFIISRVVACHWLSSDDPGVKP